VEIGLVARYIARMSKEGRDHYIPVFYLKQWNSADDQLCEFSRPHKKVVHKRVAPKGTGFMHGLYSVPDFPPEKARYLETEFMQKLDGKAAQALQTILKVGPGDIGLVEGLSIAWASFLYSLILRVPETITSMQKLLDDRRAKLATMMETTRSMTDVYGVTHTTEVKHRELKVQEVLPGFLAPGLVVRGIAAMQWRTKSVAAASHTMLTSDRPVIMTNGIAHAEGHLAIPISPTILFVATRNAETYGKISAMSDDLTVKAVNSKVSEQAVDYIYGVDSRQLSFVENRLGKRVQSTPLG
jgi:hypothetical protein